MGQLDGVEVALLAHEERVVRQSGQADEAVPYAGNLQHRPAEQATAVRGWVSIGSWFVTWGTGPARASATAHAASFAG
jgi:hypothetical protein